MRLLSIASGSSGNCIYVGNDQTHLLIDAGISGKRIEQGLNTIGLSIADIDAVLVTHEHIDHIGGLGVICRKHGLKVYATYGTICGIKNTKSVGKIEEGLLCPIDKCEQITIKDFVIHPMEISHDAMDPVAYRIYADGKKLAIVTDIGHFTQETVEQLQGMNAVLLEANHDVQMLQVGGYPYPLKQRILGNRGHLSNENAGRLLCKLLHDDLKTIVLGHLSNENNLPDLAYESVRLEISMGDNPYQASDFQICVAKRSCPSQVIEL